MRGSDDHLRAVPVRQLRLRSLLGAACPQGTGCVAPTHVHSHLHFPARAWQEMSDQERASSDAKYWTLVRGEQLCVRHNRTCCSMWRRASAHWHGLQVPNRLELSGTLHAYVFRSVPRILPAGQPFFLAEDKDDTVFSNSTRAAAVLASLEAVKQLPTERERAAAMHGRRTPPGAPTASDDSCKPTSHQ